MSDSGQKAQQQQTLYDYKLIELRREYEFQLKQLELKILKLEHLQQENKDIE